LRLCGSIGFDLVGGERVEKSRRVEFDQVDRTTDPADFVRYLDATRATDFYQEIKRRSYDLLALHEGDAALDVGCGTGGDVVALAGRVGPSGRAIGLDFSATMIAEAQRRAADAGVAAQFVQGDAHHLDFPDGSFDGCRAERLLQHAHDPRTVLAEMMRVAKPGGRVVIWESELEMLVFDAPDRAVSRAMQRYICDGFRNGAIGHQLYRMFHEAGLTDVQPTLLGRALTDFALVESAFDLRASAHRAAAEGIITAAEAADWIASLEAANDAGHFFCGVAGFLVSGRKPQQLHVHDTRDILSVEL
jgi:ubiquinone/menaquinone biosynthesis C-methylase UbiE